MNDVFNLMDKQPVDYPKWRRGFVATSAGIQPTLDQHLVLYELKLDTPLIAFGSAVAACQFMDGAAYVVPDLHDALLNSVHDAHCPACMEVELQYALREE